MSISSLLQNVKDTRGLGVCDYREPTSSTLYIPDKKGKNKLVQQTHTRTPLKTYLPITYEIKTVDTHDMDLVGKKYLDVLKFLHNKTVENKTANLS